MSSSLTERHRITSYNVCYTKLLRNICELRMCKPMKLVLLSGGSGKRLWPLSNDARSKQFLKVLQCKHSDEFESMVQRVWGQLDAVGLADFSFVATSKFQIDIIYSQLGHDIPVIVEPMRRDTFPAIALAATYLYSVADIPLNEVICILPVDSYVEDNFFERLKDLEKVRITSYNVCYTKLLRWTKDIACRNNDGLIFIKSRADEMIIKGGMNIYPREIEQVLLKNWEIRDIIAYGIRKKEGMRIGINVVLSENVQLDQREIMSICSNTLPLHLLPDEINVVEHIDVITSYSIHYTKLYETNFKLLL